MDIDEFESLSEEDREALVPTFRVEEAALLSHLNVTWSGVQWREDEPRRFYEFTLAEAPDRTLSRWYPFFDFSYTPLLESVRNQLGGKPSKGTLPKPDVPIRSYRDAERYISRNTDSYTRLEAIVDLRPALANAEWLRLLGEHWSSCDNIWDYRLELKAYLGIVGPLKELMNDDESKAFEALPEVVTCYRGCSAWMLFGASWSLDRAIANAFPYKMRYKATNPVLITASVKKHRILAVKLDRGEQELITFSARRLKVEPADEQRAKAYESTNKGSLTIS